jgi:shikimate kinase
MARWGADPLVDFLADPREAFRSIVTPPTLPTPTGASKQAYYLIGMMGAGKTTVGRSLSRQLGLEFLDADRELEARLGVAIPTVFELEGEAGFRRRESALIDELTRRDRLVLATGGGVVLDPANRRALAERGLVIYLRASVTDLWHRLRRDRHRPLLRTADPRGRIESLVAERDPLYMEAAHLVVETGRQPVEMVVADIIERLSALLPDRPDTPDTPDTDPSQAHSIGPARDA